MVNLPFQVLTNARTCPASGQGCHSWLYIHAEEWRHLATGRFIPDPVTTKGKWLEARLESAYQTLIRVGADYDALIYEMLFRKVSRLLTN